MVLFSSLLRSFPVALVLALANGSPVQDKRQASLDSYIKSQADVSIKGVLANIGPDGSKAQGVSAGLVLASPSRSDPDCL